MATAAGAKTLYFPEVGPQWQDWVQVINVGSEPTRVLAIARHANNGQPVWSEEKTIASFEAWVPNVEAIKINSSMQFSADQPIVAERHMHNKSNVIDLIGAAEEYETVGRRLFFPEISSGAQDWFRFLNVSEADAVLSMIVRDRSGKVIWQHQHTIKPLTSWSVNEGLMPSANGTVEVMSTQAIVGERHMHYQGGKTTIGQFGQVITDGAKTLFIPEVGPVWNDWVVVVNLSHQEAKVSMVARQDQNGQPVWSKESTLNSFQCWTPPMDEVKIKSSVEIKSDQPIAAERHMRRGTEIIDLPGASVEGGFVGRRLFFPEIYSGAYDWFRILNISEADALISLVVRNRKGDVTNQRQGTVKPFHCWDFDDNTLKNIVGTVEVISTQPVIAERHCHYQSIHQGAVVGEYGVVIGE